MGWVANHRGGWSVDRGAFTAGSLGGGAVYAQRGGATAARASPLNASCGECYSRVAPPGPPLHFPLPSRHAPALGLGALQQGQTAVAPPPPPPDVPQGGDCCVVEIAQMWPCPGRVCPRSCRDRPDLGHMCADVGHMQPTSAILAWERPKFRRALSMLGRI